MCRINLLNFGHFCANLVQNHRSKQAFLLFLCFAPAGIIIKNHPGQQVSQLHQQPHFERFAGKINEQRPRKAAGVQRLALNPQPRMVRYSELGEADQKVSAGAIHP